jgi:dimethylhistidine N-methyltransferase
MASTDIVDHEPDIGDFRKGLVDGLSKDPKDIPAKFLYDERGSELFEEICETDDYYPTRTEIGIMETCLDEVSEWVGPRARIVEFGAGSGRKTRMFLDALEEPAAYLPIEISKAALRGCAERMREAFPDLEVIPICADYTEPVELPEPSASTARTVGYYPGSTLGNFEPDEAAAFLQRIRQLCGEDGGLVIGIDLVKDRETLEAAYDDSEGVTEAFTMNILDRANREADADFDRDAFDFEAEWQPENRRVQLRLVSKRAQTVHVGDESFDFEAGEPIVTEHSYKFQLEQFADLARDTGFTPVETWTDDREHFSLWYLET